MVEVACAGVLSRALHVPLRQAMWLCGRAPVPGTLHVLLLCGGAPVPGTGHVSWLCGGRTWIKGR